MIKDEKVSSVKIQLLKGPIFRGTNNHLWNELILKKSVISDYMNQIGLSLYIDEDDGYAFLRQNENQEETEEQTENELPRLINKRSLSLLPSTLCILLRKRMIEHESQDGSPKLIITRDEIYSLLELYVRNEQNEKKARIKINLAMKKLKNWGYCAPFQARRISLRSRSRKIIKSLIGSEWLKNSQKDLNDLLANIEGKNKKMEIEMKYGNSTEFIKGGYYLDKLELYNWGTFHNRIWAINPQMEASLVTGDFGSGKSTIVDAITALLVPPNKIVFNKSAGADKQERNFTSYVLGHYKSESDENTRKGSKKGLREDRKSFTAILAIFKNRESKKLVTLAQVMTPRLKGDSRTPDKIFIVSEKELSIESHIGNQYPSKGKNKFKKWLLKQNSIQIFDTFSSYADCFRRLLRLKSNQALDLFHKAISLKQIENLTAFVRNHMLEEHDTKERINELCVSFQQLNELHDIVVKEREQVEHLNGISDKYKDYLRYKDREELTREAANSTENYFAKIKIEKYSQKLEELKKKISVADKIIHTLEKDIEENDIALEKVKEQIIKEGGARTDELKQALNILNSRKREREDKEKRYSEIAKKLELKTPIDENSFYDNTQKLEMIARQAEIDKKSLKEEYSTKIISFQKYREKILSIEDEINSLKKRKSKIPYSISKIRDEMVEALELRKDELPFVGELLRVKNEEKDWEGAIERVLRSFGLSIVVSEELYTKVSSYVEKTHLKGKIVYLKISDTERVVKFRSPEEANSLVYKLNIKDDSGFQDWLWNQLCQKFDYSCIKTIEEFRRKEKAITINGQIKSNRSRHEKDDRSSIHDRSRYILGWENKEKIQEFKNILIREKDEAHKIGQAITQNSKKEDHLQKKIIAVEGLKAITNFSEIDSNSIAYQIEKTEGELQEIEKTEKSSLIMKNLREKEINLKALRSKLKSKNNKTREEKSKADLLQEQCIEGWKSEKSKVKNITEREETILFPIVSKAYRR